MITKITNKERKELTDKRLEQINTDKLYALQQIGRASCRERVQITVVAVSLKKKKEKKEKKKKKKTTNRNEMTD